MVVFKICLIIDYSDLIELDLSSDIKGCLKFYDL